MAYDIHWEQLKQRVKDLNWRVKINETKLSITRLIDNSKIVLKTADNPDRLRGRGLHKVIIDEFRDMEQNVWEEILRPALSDYRGQAIFISTTNGYDVLYDLYVLGQKGNPDWKSWTYKTIDSPFISKEEIEQAKQELDEKTFRQEYEASFETATGRVYYAFDRKYNLRDKEFNSRLPVGLTLDFNVNPCKWGVSQEYPDGTYAIDEVVKADTYTREMALEVKSRYPDSRFIVWGDFTGTAKNTRGRSTDYDILKEILGSDIDIRIKKTVSVIDGVNAFNARILNAKGERKFFVHPKLKHTIESMEKTLWHEMKREIDKSTEQKNADTAISDGYRYKMDYEYSLKGKPIGGQI
jgi:hypothetical protein